jgi:hypothetical protein
MNEIKSKVLIALFGRDKKMYFSKLKSKPEDFDNNPAFVVKVLEGGLFEYYELKDEFKAWLSSITLSDIIQMEQAEYLKATKKWVTFLGVIVIIQIIAGLIFVLSML